MFFNKKGKEHKGKVFVGNEIMPIFTGRANETNKDLLYIEEVKEGVLIKARNFEYGNRVEHYDMSKVTVITQKEVPLIFKKAGEYKVKNNNNEYIKDGFQQGQVYRFDNMGYLQNNVYIKKVYLVTDQYVFFKSMDTGSIMLNTYEELERIGPVKLNM